MATRDRRLTLLASTTTNGVDFVEVAAADQTQLRVHFLNAVSLRGHLASPAPVTITGGEVIATVPVNPVNEATAWSADSDGRPVLFVSVPAAGDFSLYTLTVNTVSPAGGVPVLDPFLDAATFTFKVNCPVTVDAGGPAGMAGPPYRPAPATTDPAIDYLAKDFASFRRALSDFSALKYPAWAERSEADLGVVLMEALCAVADDLSYYQDRVAAEATLDTATQAVSVLRHARLVDYEPAPATVASVLLQLDVAEPVQLTVAQPSQSGLLCSAQGPDGQAVPFEAGGGLADPVPAAGVQLDPRWNRYRYTSGARQTDAAGDPVFNLVPYWWDDSDQVLPATATQLWLAGTGLGLLPGQQLVLDTDGPSSADPPVRELITVSGGADAPQETEDQLFDVAVTQVTFTPALAFDHDQAVSRLAGNLVGAVQGARAQETFAIPGTPGTQASPPPAPVVVRIGHDWQPDLAVPDYRYTLGGAGPAAAAAGPLSWLSGNTGTATLGDAVIAARPDLVLTADNPDGTQVSWPWCRSLLDVAGGEQGTAAFTLTPERYSPVAVIDGMTCFDYDGDDATTIRFGDGVFGQVPVPGTRFTVSYRTGLGAAGNLPADTITAVAAGSGPTSQASQVLACTNPFPAAGGGGAQTIQQVRDAAPEQFRAEPLCVVRPEDYVAAAQSLPWVAQAGSVFRWTGSWLSAYTTADPAASEQVSPGQLTELTELLNRQRLAGYASYVLSPRYLSVDLRVTVQAETGQFRGDVAAAVLARLRPGTPPGGAAGFFDHSRWRFGMPLQRSALAAAVQAVPGVEGVLSIEYRLRGVQAGFTAMPDTVTIAPDQILRADDDPSRPEAGSVAVIGVGGK